jgi:phosphoglycolate phosphatase-like HAD superfamily hydrolase
MQLDDQALARLAQKSEWVLDVDDCMYDIDTGLHDFIKGNIVGVFNDVARSDAQGQAIRTRLRGLVGESVRDIANVTADELGTAFPPIVQTLAEIYPDRLFDYINRFYGDSYAQVPGCARLVEAFRVAGEKGIGIHFYTNGPSSPIAGEVSHLQQVMARRGFESEAIEAMRGRTYDLLMSIRAGRGKPTAEGMRDFLEFSGIDPRNAFMADDGPKNLKTAKEAGMDALWTWTSDRAPKESDVALAETLGIPRVRDAGAALLRIAQAHRPQR